VPSILYGFDDDSIVVGKYTLEVATKAQVGQSLRQKMAKAGAAVIVFNESPV
jgi:hypothetical protein